MWGRSLAWVLIVGASIAMCPGGWAGADDAGQVQLYTAYNMWYENPKEMWTINYKKGQMIPAGTPVTDIKVKLHRQGREAAVYKIEFSRPDTRAEYCVYYRGDYHPGTGGAEGYVKRMFTEKGFDALTEGFSELEIDAVKRGQPVPGMSKRAVLLCWGYPPEHQTPSLDDNAWMYWIARVVRKRICFDDHGLTVKCSESESVL